MKKVVFVLCLTIALALAAWADDVSGKWSGSFTPEGQQAGTAFLVLKQSGSTLSGTAGPDESQQWPITNGKVEGNKLTGVTTSPEGATYKFVLTADGDHITGNLEVGMSGQSMKATLDVKRVKQ
jgi:hypothetical protein